MFFSLQNLWKLEPSNPDSVLVEVCQLLLPPAKQRWATCVCLIPHNSESHDKNLTPNSSSCVSKNETHGNTSNNEQYLFLGDRAGSVHMYYVNLATAADLPTSEGSPRCQTVVQSFFKVHGKSGVTDMCYHDERFYTCGRDGAYAVYQYENRQWNKLHSMKVLQYLL